MLTSAASDGRGRDDSSLSPGRSLETLGSLQHLVGPSSLSIHPWTPRQTGVWPTAACTELWGEAGHPDPAWTSSPCSELLKLQAEVGRELELPDRSEDRERRGHFLLEDT